MSQTTLLIDGNALMHRSYHAVNFNPIYEEKPVGMVFGFTSGILRSIQNFQPSFCVVAFDTKEKTFRHQMDENYKAQRQKAPDDFYPQLPYIYEMLEAINIPILKKPGYEADDFIGTLAIQSESQGHETIILSHDLDYSQLLSEKTKLCRSVGKVSEDSLFGPIQVEAKMGVPPSLVVDFKAIAGDSSDNYKGIEGIGPKGATTLLNEFGSLENILHNLSQLPEKFQKKFEGQTEYVLHCQALAKINTEVPIDFELSSETQFNTNFESLADFCEKMKFWSLRTSAQKMSSSNDAEKNKEQKNSSGKEPQMSLF